MNADNSPAVDLSRLFAPQVLLPAQLAHSAAHRWLRRLYGAILEDALGCLEDGGSPNTRPTEGSVARRGREAWTWIMSDAETCFSFLTICWLLDLNAAAVRAEARRRVAPGPEIPPEAWQGLQRRWSSSHRTNSMSVPAPRGASLTAL